MSVRFGKLPCLSDYRTLRFGAYASPQLPPPPPAFSVLTAAVLPKLGIAPSPQAIRDLFPMLGNDRYGDCAAVGLAHSITIYHALLGAKLIPDTAMVEKLYFHLTGGVDSGLALLDVLNYWRRNVVITAAGADGREGKILSYVRLNPHNHLHVQQAMNLFGALYLGFQCQENVEKEFDQRVPWQPGKLTNSGHCVVAVGYDQQTVDVLTWGDHQYGTWAWFDECVDEIYAIIPIEASNPSFAPGFDLATLKRDLGMVAN